jgi:polyhydroxyalkanoate synthesis regulator phasin
VPRERIDPMSNNPIDRATAYRKVMEALEALEEHHPTDEHLALLHCFGALWRKIKALLAPPEGALTEERANKHARLMVGKCLNDHPGEQVSVSWMVPDITTALLSVQSETDLRRDAEVAELRAEVERLKRTVDLLSNSEECRMLTEGLKDLAEGRSKSLEEIREELKL